MPPMLAAAPEILGMLGELGEASQALGTASQALGAVSQSLGGTSQSTQTATNQPSQENTGADLDNV